MVAVKTSSGYSSWSLLIPPKEYPNFACQVSTKGIASITQGDDSDGFVRKIVPQVEYTKKGAFDQHDDVVYNLPMNVASFPHEILGAYGQEKAFVTGTLQQTLKVAVRIHVGHPVVLSMMSKDNEGVFNSSRVSVLARTDSIMHS